MRTRFSSISQTSPDPGHWEFCSGRTLGSTSDTAHLHDWHQTLASHHLYWDPKIIIIHIIAVIDKKKFNCSWLPVLQDDCICIDKLFECDEHILWNIQQRRWQRHQWTCQWWYQSCQEQYLRFLPDNSQPVLLPFLTPLDLIPPPEYETKFLEQLQTRVI